MTEAKPQSRRLGYPPATASRAPTVSAELVDRIAAGAPIRELLLVQALGHARVPTAEYRPVYHRARQGQWVASVLRDNPGYRLERLSGGDGDR